MSKHTPGPWAYALEYGPNITEPPRITTIGRCANYVIGLPSDYPGGNYRDGDPSGDEEADARLIAAAPEMLEVLEDIKRKLRVDDPLDMYDSVCAVIAKAGSELFNTEVDRASGSGRTQS
jgi:hypothetical protein